MSTFNSHVSFSICFLPLILLLAFFVDPSVSEPRASVVALICSNKTSSPAERDIYISNFLATMDAVSPLVAAQKYALVVNGTGNDTVYAFGECMKDLDQNDCDFCFAQMKTQIPRCLPFQLATRGGRVFSDGCYLRYDEYNFFNETVGRQDRTVCADKNVTGVNQTVFRDNTVELVRNLSTQAVKNEGFFAGFVEKKNVTVYGLAQCWEPLNASGCQECLGKATDAIISSCLLREEGRVLNAGCYMRYSTQKFYNNSGSPTSGGNGGHNHLAVILAVTSSVLALVLIVSAAGFMVKKKLAKKAREKKQLGSLLSVVNRSNLSFSYETLEKATDYFNNCNKLGQGGSGSVFKGILPDGKIVAVKRLFFNTTQWVDHFFNEVNLISRIDHKNLVKLLGCSITGPESLLVYEYIPNQSLHDYLFGCPRVSNPLFIRFRAYADPYDSHFFVTVRKDVQPLSWEMRYKIILGTAEGLAYLHEESNLRIIHRDIKLSNILLDEDFTPKIADFGLARLFPEDMSHLSTAVAGTLGYMAPEYVVRGKLTEKADIYSFGVLMLEVISGRRINAFHQDPGSILQRVWSLYGTSRLSEAVDPILGIEFDNGGEACRLLQIGLLCAQASFDLRPPMSSVVKMIEGSLEVSRPTQPPFLNPASAETSRAMSPSTFFPQNDQSQSSGSRKSMTESFIEPR